MDYKDLKKGDIIHIKGIFGIDYIGIFNKVENDILHLYCCSYTDMHNICFVKDDKYCTFHIDAINVCVFSTENEIIEFYNKIGKYFTEEYDKDWYNHFTDSSYFDIQDFLLDMFCIKTEEYDNDMIYPNFVDEIHHYIWEKLCKSMGYKNYDGNEFVEQLVNKQEFIEKTKKWLEKTLFIHTETEKINYWGIVNSESWVTSDYDSVEDFINSFCKAMDE